MVILNSDAIPCHRFHHAHKDRVLFCKCRIWQHSVEVAMLQRVDQRVCNVVDLSWQELYNSLLNMIANLMIHVDCVVIVCQKLIT